MGYLFPEYSQEIAETAERLRSADQVTVLAHIKPDADAIGSACALARALEKIGVTVGVQIGQPFPHPENLSKLPGVAEISYGAPLPTDGLIVTVDCASVDRTGMYQDQLLEQADRVVVIDHHKTNPGFGGHNLILDAESTSTIIRELCYYLGAELDQAIACCLYAGLVTDTGNFRWGSPRMHRLAAELLEFGLNPRELSLQLSDAMSARDMQLMGSILSDLSIVQHARYSVAVMSISAAQLRVMSQTAVEAVIDYARVLIGSDVGVVLKEFHEQRWGVSLRSTAVDVSVVAQRLGGGGHKPAAGYSAQGTREQVVADLLAALPQD